MNVDAKYIKESNYKVKPLDGERQLDSNMVKSKKEAKNLKFGDHEFRNFNMDEGSLLDPEMESRIEDFIK